MASVADELKQHLDRLIAEGGALQRGIAVNSGVVSIDDLRDQVKDGLKRNDEKARAEGRPKPKGTITKRIDAVMEGWVLDFRSHYEGWYSEALGVISQVLPDRTADFRHLYKVERRKQIDHETYTLADYQIGLSVTRGYRKEAVLNPDETAHTKFSQQLNMVRAARKALDSRLVDIQGVLQADLFDSGLDAARELLKNGFLRPAGVVAGVVLERHLAAVVRSHKTVIRRKAPTISHYNDSLKEAGVLDVPRWRAIQGLADIRNLCAHATGREPTAEEVRELIDGVARISKNVS